jgi:flagellar biosynthesis protein FlhG
MDAYMTLDEKAGNGVKLWAVGGGKGGTGKTFLVSQLAIALADQDKRVIVIDTDFGGANVHSFFGIKRAPKTINDFFEKKEPLENLLIAAGKKNIKIIAGDYRSINSGNLNYAIKSKLFRHIRELDADYILLDLGGGTGSDTIDALLLADRMIVVAVPEITSAENLFQFVKSTFFRKLKQVLGEHGLKETVKNVWEDKKKYGIKNSVDLLHYLKENNENVYTILSDALKNFAFYVVLNKVRNSMEIKEGFSIRSICIKHIGVDTRYAGYIDYDLQFWKNLSLMRDVSKIIVPHTVRKDVMLITDNIIRGDQMKMIGF